jgi:uncharacterized protein (TIGR03382 family)
VLVRILPLARGTIYTLDLQCGPAPLGVLPREIVGGCSAGPGAAPWALATALVGLVRRRRAAR